MGVCCACVMVWVAISWFRLYSFITESQLLPALRVNQVAGMLQPLGLYLLSVTARTSLEESALTASSLLKRTN